MDRLRGFLWLLLCVGAGAAGAGAPGVPAADAAVLAAQPAAAFERAAPLPPWADLAAPPALAAQDAHLDAVVSLLETQLNVASPPVWLTNRVVHVNHPAALGQIGQLAIEFRPQYERLLLHRVLVLRGGATIDHTRTAQVHFMQREPRLEDGVVSGVITALVVVPGVRAGDALQLVHSLVGANPILGARHATSVPWDLPYPIAARRLVLHAPAQRQLAWRWIGGTGDAAPFPVERLVGGVRRLQFEQGRLEAARAEPLSPPRVQPQRRLQVSEFASWNEVARWALALFPQDVPLPTLLDPVLERLRAVPDPEERASLALQWVQDRVRYWSMGPGACATHPRLPAQVVDSGWGDCKDQALLLATLLRGVGIDARPTLASLATHDGPAAMLPAPDVFDHVIVQVRLAGADYYVDPTQPGQEGSLSRIGQRLEGAAVLPVDAGTQDLVVVRSPQRAAIFHTQMHERFTLPSFDADARMDVEVRWSGVDAEQLRASLRQMDPAARRRFASASYVRQYAGSRLIGDPRIDDDRRLNQLTLRASFAVPGLARPHGDAWLVPFAPGFGDAVALPAQLQRRFPLRIAPFPAVYRYRVDMTWPAGVAIAEGPPAQRLETPHFRLATTREVRGNTETRSIEFEPRVGEVPPDEVERLAADLELMARQIGGVMLARGAARPLRGDGH